MKHTEEKKRNVEQANTLFDSDLAEEEYMKEKEAKVEVKSNEKAE